MNTFTLEIVTPDKLVYSQEIEQVTVPSSDGQLTILPHHVPLFATLTDGEVVIRKNKEDIYLALGGGFIEVAPKKTIILVTRAANADELNEASILLAKKQAEEAIEKGATGDALQTARSTLRSTLIDLKIVRKRRHSDKSI
jgi:F-type H+-transporting ATPase subunit epsilon